MAKKKEKQETFSFQLWFMFCMKPLHLLCAGFLWLSKCTSSDFNGVTVVTSTPDSKTNVLATQRTHDNKIGYNWGVQDNCIPSSAALATDGTASICYLLFG